jgi:hypothetical protein
MYLTHSFTILLQQLCPVFTVPSFGTFLATMTGWLLTNRPRYLTECLLSAQAHHSKHFSCFHRLFANARWSLDELSRLLALLVVSVLVPSGLIYLVLDDTLCTKRGLTLFGAGMHYDPLRSTKRRKQTSWGHDWVTLSILVWGLPWCPTKVWALPIAFRLYKNTQTKAKLKAKTKTNTDQQPAPPETVHQTRPELGVELLCLVAGWFADRQLLVCGDSLYGGASVGRHLPTNMHLISKADAKAALYKLPTPRKPGQRGAPLKKGDRLPSMQEWIDDQSAAWEEITFDTFGLHTRLQIKSQVCLYYKATHTKPVRVVLTRDLEGKRPETMFYCTDSSLSNPEILTMYARRWATEVTYREAKQLLGFDECANRTEKAVKRTAPMALVLYTLVGVWAEQGGQKLVRYPERQWYRNKREPSFADLLSAVRRESWREKLAGVWPSDPAAERVLNSLVDFASRAA